MIQWGSEMSAQLFVTITVVFVAGMFFGSNLGVLLMCLLQVAGDRSPANPELASVQIPIKD
jgi:hypothetical protein